MPQYPSTKHHDTPKSIKSTWYILPSNRTNKYYACTSVKVPEDRPDNNKNRKEREDLLTEGKLEQN